jgi:hypothetical protein
VKEGRLQGVEEGGREFAMEKCSTEGEDPWELQEPQGRGEAETLEVWGAPEQYEVVGAHDEMELAQTPKDGER